MIKLRQEMEEAEAQEEARTEGMLEIMVKKPWIFFPVGAQVTKGLR